MMGLRDRPSASGSEGHFSIRHGKSFVEWGTLLTLGGLFVLNATNMIARVPLTSVSHEDCLVDGHRSVADCESGSVGGGGSIAGDGSTTNLTEDYQCHLYLAPSSIPDNENRPAGFGIFTTKALKKGEYVRPQGEGPSIIIPDLEAHQLSGLRPAWSQYIFIGSAIGFNAETQDPDVKMDHSLELFVDLGALTNFHSYLKNVVYDDNDVYRDNLLNRYVDPGAGAFSYHQGNKWYVTRDVEAGEELFNDYDESWFFDKQLGQAGAMLPKKDDFEKAALLLWKMKSSEFDIDMDFVDLLHEKFFSQGLERMGNLFPRTAPEMTDMVSSIFEEEDVAMALARRTVLPHSVDWIRENGRCLVDVVPKRSTIPQAGMGGFAARTLKKGEVVVPAPTILQITDKSTLDMYDLDGYQAVGGDPVGKQLLLNYCFGHHKSTMVVCPASNANLINHCGPKVKREGQCSDDGPNAMVRWATEFDPETSRWLDMSLDDVDELVRKGRRGLSLEIVALRDIQAGEEIFIDYGPEWEEAWERHLSTWSAPKGNPDSYVSINEMNQDVESWIRTAEDLETDPYPIDVRVACFVKGFYHPCEIVELAEVTEAGVAGSPLDERRRYVYTVAIQKLVRESMWEVKYRWYSPTLWYETALSSRYIRFFPGLYSSDQHLPGTFRQQIGVPDEMWPEQWKNLSQQ